MAFIVEGESREPQIINNLQSVHFKNSNFKVITLPAGQNIYMLWQRMNEDDFETDIIEILRENSEELKETLEGLDRDDFSQIFLFLTMMDIRITFLLGIGQKMCWKKCWRILIMKLKMENFISITRWLRRCGISNQVSVERKVIVTVR